MDDTERPAEPVVGDTGNDRGGYAKAAERLNEFDPHRPRPISRQLVHKWHFHRHFNGFPAAVETTGSTNGKGRPVFDLDAVEAWYISYRRHRRHDAAASGALKEQTKNVTVTEPTEAPRDSLVA